MPHNNLTPTAEAELVVPATADIQTLVNGALRTTYNEQARPDLKGDFKDNISGLRQNNMSPHMYSNIPLWHKVISDKNYYAPFSDKEIIDIHKKRLSEFQFDVLNEFGAGDVTALRTKTQALARLWGVKNVVLVDFSLEALHGGALQMASDCKDIKTHTLMRNFNTQSCRTNLEGRKVFTLLGLTAGNSEHDDLSIYLKHYLAQMDKGDILIMSVDRNINRFSLMQAYGAVFGDWVDDMRRHLRASFPDSGFNPDALRYFRSWDDKSHVLQFGFDSIHTQNVCLDDEYIHVRKDKQFLYLPSRRFTQDKLDGFYARTSAPVDAQTEKRFRLLDILPDRRDHVCWQILEADTRPIPSRAQAFTAK